MAETSRARRGDCEVDWPCTFAAKDAPEADVKALIEGLYTAGFEGLNTIHGG